MRKQAKSLLKAAREGDPVALDRLGRRELILSRAQLVVARENGYSSWPALVAAADADAASFVLAATGRLRDHAEAMLRARPEIATDPWARLVLGHEWRGDPNEVGGPRGWPALMYACHSVFRPSHLVGELLGRGADPRACAVREGEIASPLSGAAGVLHDVEMTRLLLERGADPNDTRALTGAAAGVGLECLPLLLDHGAHPGPAAIRSALDYNQLEPLRLLLEAGADVNEEQYVIDAVRRGRRPAFIQMLAAFGADLDRRSSGRGEGTRPRSAYEHAVVRGDTEAAAALARLGASTAIERRDAAVGAFVRGESAAKALPNPLDATQEEGLALAALRGRLDDVIDLVGPDFRTVIGCSPEGGLLHHASWYGKSEAVSALLARGADVHAETDADFSTPVAWAVIGSRWWGNPGFDNGLKVDTAASGGSSGKWWEAPGFDYLGVVVQLVEAGAELEARFIGVAQGPLADWLTERTIDANVSLPRSTA